MLLKTQMTPSAEAKSLERVFNRLLPSVPFAVQSHWEKMQDIVPCYAITAWPVSRMKQVGDKSMFAMQNVAKIEKYRRNATVEKDNISLNQSRDTWL